LKTQNCTRSFVDIPSLKSIVLKIVSLRCYINYTGCLSVIVLTLNLRNSRSSLVHLLLARILIHKSLDICHLALSTFRILTFSPFLGQRQSSVRVHYMLLRRPFLILSLRTSDQLTTSLRFAAFQRRFTSAMPSINTSDITSASASTYFVDIERVKKLILTYLYCDAYCIACLDN